jgi:hypothetical protein
MPIGLHNLWCIDSLPALAAGLSSTTSREVFS